MLEDAASRIHGGLPELLIAHLTETFVPLGLDLLLIAVTVVLDEGGTLLVVPAVLAVVTLRALIERRASDIEVALLNHLFHMTEEQGHNQSSNMRTIDIGIGHDNHFVVADLGEVERFRVLFGSEGDTERREDVPYLFGLEHLMLHRFLNVEDLTAKRQDSLVYTVTSGLGSTACRVSLDEEELALSCIFRYAISQFTGQTTTGERRLTEDGLTSITGCDTSLRCENDFLHDLLRIIRMLLEVVLQRLSYCRRNHTCYFGVTEFGLRLAFKLRLCHFDRDDRRQTLTEIVRIDGRVTVFIFQFRLLQHLAVLSIFLHHTGQRSAETGYVRTTLDGIDIIDIGVYVLIEIGVVDHRYLYRRTVFVGIEVDHLADERRTGTVDVTHELGKALLRVEGLLLALGHFGAILQFALYHDALVLQYDLDSCVQECELTHTIREDLPVINGLRKDRIIRPELHESTSLALLPVTRSLLLRDHMYRRQRFAFRIILTVDLSVTINLHVHLRRECVHTAHTHTVETTGHLIAVFIELTTGVEHGHYDLQRGFMLLRVHIYRDTTTVILYGNGVILIDMDRDLIAETGERLVDGVIDYLIHQVVQTLLRDVADIHRRSLAHRL